MRGEKKGVLFERDVVQYFLSSYCFFVFSFSLFQSSIEHRGVRFEA